MGEMRLPSQINRKISSRQTLFVIVTAIAMFSAAGLSGAYAQVPGMHQGQGGQGQQFLQHGNFTSHQRTQGSSHMGTFMRNGTVNGMNSFNHTRTGYPMKNNVTLPIHMQAPQKPVLYSTGATTANTTNTSIPSWVKSNAKLWSTNQIADSDFVSGLQYLIQQGILKVPPTHVNSTETAQIPSWLRNNANLWSTGQISDSDFIQGIQYLISNGMIKE